MLENSCETFEAMAESTSSAALSGVLLTVLSVCRFFFNRVAHIESRHFHSDIEVIGSQILISFVKSI